MPVHKLLWMLLGWPFDVDVGSINSTQDIGEIADGIKSLLHSGLVFGSGGEPDEVWS